jgi:type IV pilus assembly protein PilX
MMATDVTRRAATCMTPQRGIAVLICLLMLIMVMLLGVSAAQLSLQGEKAVRGERDRDVAFLAAEDALADAELDIQGGDDSDGAGGAGADAPSGRGSAFGPDAGDAFAADCGGAAPGLRLRAQDGVPPVWQSVDLSGVEDGGACSVDYGAYTGAQMLTGEGFLPFRKPRYVIERMECRQPGDDASAGAASRYCYRVTVMGFGAKPATEVVLQSVFSKPE